MLELSLCDQLMAALYDHYHFLVTRKFTSQCQVSVPLLLPAFLHPHHTRLCWQTRPVEQVTGIKLQGLASVYVCVTVTPLIWFRKVTTLSATARNSVTSPACPRPPHHHHHSHYQMSAPALSCASVIMEHLLYLCMFHSSSWPKAQCWHVE